MSSDHKTEIRFELYATELSVLDGYCQATGRDRTSVFREILDGWSREKLHISTLICRVAGVNPQAPEQRRND